VNFIFPNTTDTLIAMNPRSWPDSVRALLRFQALVGEIREIRGRWYEIRKESDESLVKVPRYKTLPPEAFRPCVRCGKLTHHPKHKYCSPECAVQSRTRKRGCCEQCGKENPRADARFCSRRCVIKYRTLTKPPCVLCGKPVAAPVNKFCSLVCSNKAKEGRRFGSEGPL
jgi:hypothetical protein